MSMTMAPPPAVITVFKCPCGTFIPSAVGLDNHLHVCSKLRQITYSNSRTDELSDEAVNVAGVKAVNFYSPRVIVTRLSKSRVREIQGEIKRESGLRDTDASYKNEEEEEKVDPAIQRKVEQKPEVSDGAGCNAVPFPLPPRRSSLRAVQKLREITKNLREPGPLLNLKEDDCNNEYKVSEGECVEFVVTKLEKDSKSTRKVSRKRARRPNGSLADHQYIHKCNMCPTKFKSDKDYNWHMFNIHGDGSKNHEIFTCPICGRMLNKRIVFFSHVKSHEKAEAIEEAFDLWNKWPKKKPNNGMILNFSCKYCLIPHSSHSSFLTHMESEHPEKGRFCKYSCQYCEIAEFDSMKHLILHFRKSHPNEYYGKTIIWGSSKPINEKGRPKGRCDICNKIVDLYYLRAHKEKVHSKRKGSREENEDLDRNDGFFRCPMPDCFACKFKNRALLKSHFILHLEKNPFACPFPGCTVKCDAQCHLNRHMKLHTATKLPTCEKCGVSYSRIDKLRNHVCCFDPSKLKYENGLLRPKQSNSRLKRASDRPFQRADQIDETIDDDKPSIKSELKEDSGNTEQTEENQGSFTYEFKKERISINSLMLADPVFIKACRENPGFKELILGTGGGGRGKKTKSHRCPKCLTNFHDHTALQKHSLHCNDDNKEESKLKAEMKNERENSKCMKSDTNVTSLEKVGCPICLASFENSTLLDCHVESKHQPHEVFRCSACKAIFSTKKIRDTHIKGCPVRRPFRCPKCSRRFSTKSRLDIHIEVRCEKKAKCSKCGKVLVNSTSLSRHWLLIHGVKLKPLATPKPTSKKIKRRVKKVTNKRKKNKTAKPMEDPTYRPSNRCAEREGQMSNLDYSIVKIETEPEVTMSIDICDTDDTNLILEVPKTETFVKTEPL